MGLGSSESLSANLLRSAAHSIQLVSGHSRGVGMHIRLALRPPERCDAGAGAGAFRRGSEKFQPPLDGEPQPKNGGFAGVSGGAADDDGAPGSGSTSRRGVSFGENISAGADATAPQPRAKGWRGSRSAPAALGGSGAAPVFRPPREPAPCY